MEISPLNREVKASELPLERLATAGNVSQKEKIGEVSRQFEGVLLRQILSQAQKPMFKSSLMPADGTTNAIYQDMITKQLADRISRGGTFGFAKVLEQQLTTEIGGKTNETGLPTSANGIATTDAAKVNKFISPAIQPGKRI